MALETIRGAFPEQVQQTIKMRSLQGVKKQHWMNQTDLLLTSRNSVHILKLYTTERHSCLGFFFPRNVLLLTPAVCGTKKDVIQWWRIKNLYISLLFIRYMFIHLVYSGLPWDIGIPTKWQLLRWWLIHLTIGSDVTLVSL